MIVKIAACLYILQAALCLLSLMLLPFGFSASLENLATLGVGGLFAAMGVGLFKRAPWARWLALGNSLIGWTLGTLVFVVVVGGAIFLGSMLGALFGGGLGAVYGFLILLLAAIFVVSIVISFKLYFYLRSEAGAQEFGVEVEPFGMVMGSVGTWITIAVVQGMISSGGGFGSYFPRATQPDFEQTAAQQRQFDVERERRDAERREARRLEGQRREADRLEAERLAQMRESEAVVPEETYRVQEAELPAIQPAMAVSTSEPESGETSRNQILKCRDASGSVQYTQGYCPPGTTRVEMPAHD
jgi:hypothetical protein